MIFSLAEFEGNIKLRLFNSGKKLRFYSVNQIKKFWTDYGLSDKISMYKSYKQRLNQKSIPSLEHLPIVDNGKGVGPTSDIIDALAIVNYLKTELMLRHGIIQLKDLPVKQIECFNACTTEHPEGLLVADFIEK